MTRYELKSDVNEFQVLAEGPFLRRVYKPGKTYKRDEIPENEFHKFRSCKPPKVDKPQPERVVGKPENVVEMKGKEVKDAKV